MQFIFVFEAALSIVAGSYSGGIDHIKDIFLSSTSFYSGMCLGEHGGTRGKRHCLAPLFYSGLYQLLFEFQLLLLARIRDKSQVTRGREAGRQAGNRICEGCRMRSSVLTYFRSRWNLLLRDPERRAYSLSFLDVL